MLILRVHLRCLAVAVASPLLGLVAAPGKAFAFDGRLTGVTSASVISDVAFSFGTGPETVVGVPIPAAVWLFVSGLVGLIGIARRRQPGMAMAPALAA